MFLDDSLFELRSYIRHIKEWQKENEKVQAWLLTPEESRPQLERQAEYVMKFYQESISRDKSFFIKNEVADQAVLSIMTEVEYQEARKAFLELNELFEKLLKQLTYYAGE